VSLGVAQIEDSMPRQSTVRNGRNHAGADSTAPPPAETGTEAAARYFKELAERVPQVAAVVSLPSEGGVAVWTLLRDDPHGSARQAVYRLEMLTHQEFPEAPLDFRVINEDDFPEDRRPALLPSGGRDLYRRVVPPQATMPAASAHAG
jgi:hypothetical protein